MSCGGRLKIKGQATAGTCDQACSERSTMVPVPAVKRGYDSRENFWLSQGHTMRDSMCDDQQNRVAGIRMICMTL